MRSPAAASRSSRARATVRWMRKRPATSSALTACACARAKSTISRSSGCAIPDRASTKNILARFRPNRCQAPAWHVPGTRPRRSAPRGARIAVGSLDGDRDDGCGGAAERAHRGRGGAAPPGPGAAAEARDEPVVREHRPRQRLHDLQPDPGRRRGGDDRLRRVAGRPLPRDPVLQHDDRDRPGGEGQAGAGPAGRARRADGDRRQGRRCPAGQRRQGRRRRPAPRAGRRPDRRRRARQDRFRPQGRRVDPDGRVATRGSRTLGGGALRLVRGRRHRRVRGDGCRRGELRVEDRRRGTLVQASALTARAGPQQPAAHPRRRDRAARPPPRLRALPPAHQAERCGADRGRGHGHDRAGGTDSAHEPDLCRRRAANGTAGSARPAAERARVAGLGRPRLHGQDGHADRAGAESARDRAGAGNDEGRARPGARSLRVERSEPDVDARGDPHGVSGRGRAPDDRGAVLVQPPLERNRDRGRQVRARGAGAVPTRRTQAAGRIRSGGGAPSGRDRHHDDRPRAREARGRATARPAPDRHRLDRRGVAAERARDRRVPARAEHRAARALRRPAGDRGRDRPRGRRAGERPAARRERPADEPARAREGGARDLGHRSHLTGGEEERRRGAARRGPVRGDDRRRRQRRTGAEGVAPRDRAGLGVADGEKRRRPRARAERLRCRAGHDRRGAEGAAQPHARHEAVRDQVGVRGLPRRVDRADADRLPPAAAAPVAGRLARDRDSRFLPGARAERRATSGSRASSGTSHGSRFRREQPPASGCSRATCSCTRCSPTR